MRRLPGKRPYHRPMTTPVLALLASLCLAAAPAAPPPRDASITVPLTVVPAPPDPACWRCHEAGLSAQLARKVVHAPLRGARKCGACHKPHVKGGKTSLVAEPVDLCRRCHSG